ncbi:MAG: hypothetical protein AAGG46_01490, partial [Planctomycetota bacterium]
MPASRSKIGFVAILALGVVAYVLISFGPTTLAQYDSLAQRSPALGYAYLASVGLGGLLIGGLIVWGGWRVGRNTLAKRRGDRRRGQNPSELSAGQQ